MLNKIVLDKSKLIVFMGSMNAMPMYYARKLRRLGYDVIYFVDVQRGNTLSRPENHYPDIEYPYPPWIIELILPRQIMLLLFPRLFAAIYQSRIKKLVKKEVGCFILNSFFTSLAPYLDKKSSKVSIPHGSDLDVWANVDGVDSLAGELRKASFLKYFPDPASNIYVRHVIEAQYYGYSRSDVVVYFPPGFDSSGDKVVSRLVNQNVRYVQRYDIYFGLLKGQSRAFKEPSEIMNIFSGVRFVYKTFVEGSYGHSKGNDIIIEGIAKYYLRNPKICVHFVEKGADVECAKALCLKYGIENVVVWHKEMPPKQLLKLYRESDVCFDQVGRHFIGAIGGYALWLGKPLIANDEAAVKAGLWPKNNPILSAKTPNDIFESLVKLEDVEFRRDVSNKSKVFVETYMGAQDILPEIFESHADSGI